jgi:hypothetical protein
VVYVECDGRRRRLQRRGCYVYAVGMRMRDVDVDVIGEELQEGDARMRQLCAGVGDRTMLKFRQRNENAVEVKTMRD